MAVMNLVAVGIFADCFAAIRVENKMTAISGMLPNSLADRDDRVFESDDT